MWKTLIRTVIAASLLFLLFLFIGATESKTVNSNSTKPEQEHFYHKTVDVVITDIRCTWRNVKTQERTYSVTYKSDEYDLEHTDNQVSDWSNFGYKLTTKKIKVGDIVQATLYTHTQGDKILSRELGNLEK